MYHTYWEGSQSWLKLLWELHLTHILGEHRDAQGYPIYFSLFSDTVIFLKVASLPAYLFFFLMQFREIKMTLYKEIWKYMISDKTVLSSKKFNNK